MSPAKTSRGPRRRRLSAAERAAAKRRRRLRNAGLIGVAVLAVALVAGLVVQRERARSGALRALGVQTFPDQGRQHLGAGQTFARYNSTPPTSGPHAPAAAPCGVQGGQVPNEVQVHDLEHGVVMVQYRPDLDAAQVRSLEELGRSYSSHVIVAPYPGLPNPVAATAWTKLLRLDDADLGKLRTFIDTYRQRGPEAGVPCPGG